MKRLRRIALAFAALAVLGVGGLYAWIRSRAVEAPELGRAIHAETRVYDDAYLPAIERARAALAAARDSLGAPALSVAVGVDGDLVWAEALGYADVEAHEPVALDSRFPIGSVSKSVTATAAAMLWEDGVLDLDADVHGYVPDYPDLPYPLTTRELLSHQGGIRHYRLTLHPPLFSESALDRPFETTQEALSIFSGDPLLFEPDTDFHYSTYGYTLVAAAMEGASGMPFLDILRARVFDPVGLTNTSADDRDRPAPGRVTEYMTLRFVPGLVPAPETNSSYKWAGGGLLSTPTDLVRFGGALLAGDLVSDSTRAVMFTPRTTSDGEINPQRYGLGWRNGGMSYPRGSETTLVVLHHGGTAIGAITALLLLPDSRLVVAMTANVTPPDGSDRLLGDAADIAALFLDQIGGR